jgi:hypothetical protein
VTVGIYCGTTRQHPDCTKTLKTALPTSLPDVQKLLHNINTHKTCVPDNISGRILKELKEQTASVFILIFIFKRTLNTQTRNIVWYSNQKVTIISYLTSHNSITHLIMRCLTCSTTVILTPILRKKRTKNSGFGK